MSLCAPPDRVVASGRRSGARSIAWCGAPSFLVRCLWSDGASLEMETGVHEPATGPSRRVHVKSQPHGTRRPLWPIASGLHAFLLIPLPCPLRLKCSSFRNLATRGRRQNPCVCQGRRAGPRRRRHARRASSKYVPAVLPALHPA